MSRSFSYISSAVSIIESYEKGLPLSHHTKSFFSKEKKFGSRDRKIIGAICFHYFRCQCLWSSTFSIRQKIIYSIFLCEKVSHPILHDLDPLLNEKISASIEEKINYLKLSPSSIFNFTSLLSEEIDADLFALSFLCQPDLFVRIRPGKEKLVFAALEKKEILYESMAIDSLKFKNGTKLEDVFKINKEIVIQDLNSQKVLDGLLRKIISGSFKMPISVWDACAASGGKSILIHDLLKGNVKLTVSDVRESILKNLQIRLQEAGIKIYHQFSTDLTKPVELAKDMFDVILCDVPCTGSGTWSRTPEQYFSFETHQLEGFVSKQQQIIANTIPYLDKNGFFVYITCSVFKRENEAQIEFMQNHLGLQLLEMGYLKGYTTAADTMFVALLKKG